MPTTLPIISETMSSKFESGRAGRLATSTLIHSFGCGKGVRVAALLQPAYVLFPAPRSKPWQNELEAEMPQRTNRTEPQFKETIASLSYASWPGVAVPDLWVAAGWSHWRVLRGCVGGWVGGLVGAVAENPLPNASEESLFSQKWLP